MKRLLMFTIGGEYDLQELEYEREIAALAEAEIAFSAEKYSDDRLVFIIEDDQPIQRLRYDGKGWTTL